MSRASRANLHVVQQEEGHSSTLDLRASVRRLPHLERKSLVQRRLTVCLYCRRCGHDAAAARRGCVCYGLVWCVCAVLLLSKVDHSSRTALSFGRGTTWNYDANIWLYRYNYICPRKFFKPYSLG